MTSPISLQQCSRSGRCGGRSPSPLRVMSLLFLGSFLCLSQPLSEAHAAPAGGRGALRIEIPAPSRTRLQLPAEPIEEAGAQQYQRFIAAARDRDELVAASDPRARRLRAIMERMLPLVGDYHERAAGWSWVINLIQSPTVNAACFPGGKIFVFTGIIERLSLSDDEIAALLGHEIGHALWEHARERLAKGQQVRQVRSILERLVDFPSERLLGLIGEKLINLKFSRNNETEADLVGLELMARAGFDPAGAVRLWEKMERLHASEGGAAAAEREPAPQGVRGRLGRWARRQGAQLVERVSGWWSTHPRSAARRQRLEEQLPVAREIRAQR